MNKRFPATDYLDHMIEAIDRVAQYLKEIPSVEMFAEKGMHQDAVIQRIQILGEASTQISKAYPLLVRANSDVPWEKMSSMRNRLVHNYFQVDIEIVWKTVQNDLPGLRVRLKSLRESLIPKPDDGLKPP